MKKPHVLVNAQQEFIDLMPIEENTIDKSLIDWVSIEAKTAPRFFIPEKFVKLSEKLKKQGKVFKIKQL